MKTVVITLLSLSFFTVINLKAQYETFQLETVRSGETLIHTENISPLNQLAGQKDVEFDSLNMSYAGGWSLGQSFSVASSQTGDTVFIGAGAGVIIVDATDPANPVELSQIHARALIDDIQYSAEQGKVYLSAYHSGFEVWDVADIENPFRVGRAGTSGLPRGGIYVPASQTGQNPYAFLVTVADGIDVFELESGTTPIKINNQSFTASLVWDSFGIENLLMITSGTTGTKALDISNPMALENPFNVPGNSTSVAVKDNLVYVVNANSGLSIHDISNPPAALLGQVALQGYPYRISLSGTYAYIANSTTNPGGGVNIVDIMDPGDPFLTGIYEGYQNYIASGPGKTYSTGGGEGCLFLEISDPENPAYAANIELPVSTIDIAVKDDLAITGNNGFRVFDVSDKSHPLQIGYHETEGALVKISGSIAVYCPESMGSSNMVNTMDISDPTNPVKLDHYICPYMTNDLDVRGNYAYVACWWDGLRVIDFSDPENVQMVAHRMGWTNGAIPGEEWFYCQALDIHGDYLYIVDYGPFPDEDTKGIYVFDIIDPADPVLLKRMPDYQGVPYDIEVKDDYAYLADSEGGLSIISVADPLNPVQTSYFTLNDVAWAVDVFSNYAFIANYINGGVQVVDVTIPAAPVLAGYYKQSGCFALNVTYNAGHAFVADGPAGIQIFNFDFLNITEESNLDDQPGMSVYPVPADDLLVIDMEKDSYSGIEIGLFDLNGKSIIRSGFMQLNEKITIDVSHLDMGIYLLRVKSGKFNETKKVIIR